MYVTLLLLLSGGDSRSSTAGSRGTDSLSQKSSTGVARGTEGRSSTTGGGADGSVPHNLPPRLQRQQQRLEERGPGGKGDRYVRLE